MTNVLFPMAVSVVPFSEEYLYPKPLIEIQGKTIIQRNLDSFLACGEDIHFIFVLLENDVRKFHLDKVLKLLVEGHKVTTIVLSEPTQGAVCTALLASKLIDSDEELIISNSDHVLDEGVDESLDYFRAKNSDAGCICFESVHPKWSFAKLGEDSRVVETAEKVPISKMAIAGFYYYKHGSSFVSSAMQTIRKDAQLDGKFFLSSTFNEMILKGKHISAFTIPSSSYHNFYDVSAIKAYENILKKREEK